MASVLLTHSYFLRFDAKEFRAMMPYPPLGTLYAAAVLRRRGLDVAFHDTMLSDNEETLVPALDHHRPRILVVYDDGFNYLTKMCLARMRQAAFRMTQIAKARGCTVVIFSSDATDHLAEYFREGADFVICGEAEFTLAELCAHLLQRSPPSLHDINGLAFPAQGQIVRTAPRTVAEDLDVFPFPAWKLADLESYRRVWNRRHGYFSLNMVTTRGCPFHCNWCAKPIYGQVYHSRSPQNVADEMEFVRSEYRPDHLWFSDDIFGLKPGWITSFADELEKRSLRIPFKCLSRADLLLKEENIRQLARAGCQTVWLGAESGSQKILDAMDKGTTVDQISKAAALLHRFNIGVGFFLQFGYPGETMEDIRQTFRMVHDCAPDEIGVSVSYPLPGTRFYDRVRSIMGEKQNWVDSQDLDLMFPGMYQRDFYRVLHRAIHKRFSIWRGLRTLRSASSFAPSHLRKFLRSLAAVAYHSLTLPMLRQRLFRLSGEPSAAAL